MAERRSEARRLDGGVGVGVDEALAQDRARVGRQLAADGLAGDGRGDPVELVEQARDRVAFGVELDGPARLVAQEQEAQQLGRQQVGDLVRRGAGPLRRAHLLAADVQELVGHVERRLAVEHLAADGIAAVARPAGRGEVLAAALDGDVEQAPLGGPVHVEGQLGAAPKGATRPVLPQPVAQVTWSGLQAYATVWPSQSVARVVPILPQFSQMTDTGSQPGAFSTLLTRGVDLADLLGVVERGPDVGVHRCRRRTARSSSRSSGWMPRPANVPMNSSPTK